MYAEIIGPDIVIVLIVLLLLVLPVWAAIDAAGRPTWAFERAGTNKTLWIVLPIVGIFVCGLVGIVSGIMWFASIKPKVVAVTSAGSRPDQFGSGAAPPMPPPVPTAPPASPAGWYADPAQRHELRYFDGTSWTSHVSDEGIQSSDAV